MTADLALVAPLLGAAAKKSNGSPAILIFAVVAAAFYFLFYRPQQRKAKAAREQTTAFDVGDEVLTAGGIVGHIIDIDGDRITLETSVGASFVVLKQYVIRRLEATVAVDEADDEGADDEGADDGEHDSDLPNGPAGNEVKGADDVDASEGEASHDEESPVTPEKPGKKWGRSAKRQHEESPDVPPPSNDPPLI
jgi:preprotein translocase subunit YajC